MAGVYTVSVHMSNEYTSIVTGLPSEISGSPYTVDIFEATIVGDIPDTDYQIDSGTTVLPTSVSFTAASSCSKTVVVECNDTGSWIDVTSVGS